MTSTDVATTTEPTGELLAGTGGALALYSGQTAWTEEQEAALVQLGLAEASDADRMVFLHVAQRARLDPFARQIYMIGRPDNGSTKWTIQTGIDGFRVIAERHPEYAGQTSPEWCGEDGEWREVWLSNKAPSAARVGVLRRDRDAPIYATCIFSEFAQRKRDGQLNSQWATRGAHMIAKCAEAGALRKAFPQDVAGLITDDEAHGLDRQGRATRVTSTREPSGPVDVGELTGQPTPAAAPAPRAAPSTAPRAAPPLAGGSKRATNDHTKRLMAAARRPESPEDTKEWAENVLQRDIRSWGVLTCDQANLLIEKLEAGPPPGGWHVVEVVEPAAVSEQPAAAPAADADDDHAEEYAQLEAERDAAQQGQLGDDASAEQ